MAQTGSGKTKMVCIIPLLILYLHSSVLGGVGTKGKVVAIKDWKDISLVQLFFNSLTQLCLHQNC